MNADRVRGVEIAIKTEVEIAIKTGIEIAIKTAIVVEKKTIENPDMIQVKMNEFVVIHRSEAITEKKMCEIAEDDNVLKRIKMIYYTSDCVPSHRI